MADRWLEDDTADPAGAWRRSPRPRRDPDRADPAARAWWAGAAAVVALALAAALGGIGGVLLLLVAAAAGAALLLPLRLPRPARPARRERPSVPMADAAFPDYRRVAEALSWAGVSPRHYDVTTRPMLQRILAGRLAERHGVDLLRDPARAQDLVGPLWPLLDPARPARDSSAPPGVDRHTLTRIVETLERL